jgi:hypothetical protein
MMNEFDFPFFNEYLETLYTIEERDAAVSLANLLEESKLLGIKWPEYKLNYESDFEKLTGFKLTESEWCIFMAALANTKLMERRFSPYSFTVLNE